MSGDHLSAVLAQFPQAVPQPTPLRDFLAKQFPPRALLLSPWLPEKGLTMIAAPRGLGKRHLALYVAYAVASGGAVAEWKRTEASPITKWQPPGCRLWKPLPRELVTLIAHGPPPGGGVSPLHNEPCSQCSPLSRSPQPPPLVFTSTPPPKFVNA